MNAAILDRPRLSLYVTALICLASGFYGSYMLYQDYTSVEGGGLGSPMGQIESRSATVRRKASGSFVWSRANEDEPVFKKDSIQVGANSHATIRLNNGSKLEVGQNSLVVLDNFNDLSLNLKRGTFIVRTEKGDQKIAVDKKGIVKKEEIPVRLLAPSENAHFFLNPGAAANLDLTWKKPSGEKKVTEGRFALEISSSARFPAGQTRALSVEVGAEKTTLRIGEGRYFWRMTQNGKAITEAKRFSVTPMQALVPLSPNEDERFIQWSNSIQMTFRWRVPEVEEDGLFSEFTRSQIELSSSADMSSVSQRANISADAGIARLNGLAPGKYYWRLRTDYGNAKIFSPVRKFEIASTPKIQLSIVSPVNQTVLQSNNPVRFGWDAQGAETEFLFELEKADGSAFKSFLEKRGHSETLQWAKPELGKYRWKVSAFYEGKSISETQWNTLQIVAPVDIKLTSPVGQDILYWKQVPPVSFSWTASNTGQNAAYELQIATDGNFNVGTRRFVTNDTKYVLPTLKPGKYYWRVRLLDRKGAATKTTDSAIFSLGVYPPLPAPRGAAPLNGGSVDGKTGEAFLRWDALEGATHYEVSVRNDKGAFKEITSSPKLSLRGLNGGRYSWNLRAFDAIGRAGAALGWQEFTLERNALKAPKKATIQVK